jgi:hypothetical protein
MHRGGDDELVHDHQFVPYDFKACRFDVYARQVRPSHSIHSRDLFILPQVSLLQVNHHVVSALEYKEQASCSRHGHALQYKEGNAFGSEWKGRNGVNGEDLYVKTSTVAMETQRKEDGRSFRSCYR